MPFVSKYLIKEGDQFGSLVVIKTNLKNSKSLTRCVCGIEKLHRNSDLFLGRIKSCGKRVCFNKFKDLTNQKFSYLLVKSMADGRASNGSLLWNCECVCGKLLIVSSKHLLSKSTKSCGCLSVKIRINIDMLKSPIELLVNSLYSSYERSAKSRNFSFDLEKDDFQKLIFENCFYCGSPPDKIYDAYRMHNCEIVYYSGVDRKNSDLGYSKENCVSCCWFCNRAKLNSKYEDWIAWIKKIKNYQCLDIVSDACSQVEGDMLHSSEG